ncbi:iron-containing redox enzyme family protein [Trinickia fusca]|nr:iron-containing redox enzyme family protein [Trinickia fusca]
MLNIDHIAKQSPPLQSWEWPPVAVASQGKLDADFDAFMAMSSEKQREYLKQLRKDPKEHSFLLHEFLGIVSGYFFGYQDSPLFLDVDDDFEINIQKAKIVLEREAKDYWLQLPETEEIPDVETAVRRLREIAASNPSLSHPLFPYLHNHASAEGLRVFLWNEVIRNEVVDDEVAMLSVGMQGLMKVSTVSNLWDELGHGTLRNLHTYWLRRLLDGLGTVEDFMQYRTTSRPWFTKITTNIFNILLSRPGLKFMKYGWFLTNEGWVEPHFRDIVEGMNRVGFVSEDIQVYFTAHISIDPIHTSELIDGLRLQVPALRPKELGQIVAGAHMAVAAAKAQYDYVYQYIKEITEKNTPAQAINANDPQPVEEG